jgi:predicted nucleic acid-binding protein
VAEVLLRLGQAAQGGYHEFWPDDLSLTDIGVFIHTELLGPKQITDRYLLALAAKNGGRLVTFDGGIRPTAVVGASGRHLVQL